MSLIWYLILRIDKYSTFALYEKAFSHSKIQFHPHQLHGLMMFIFHFLSRFFLSRVFALSVIQQWLIYHHHQQIGKNDIRRLINQSYTLRVCVRSFSERVDSKFCRSAVFARRRMNEHYDNKTFIIYFMLAKKLSGSGMAVKSVSTKTNTRHLGRACGSAKGWQHL